MSKGYKIGVLGATGVVGTEMMKCLEDYKIPVSELRPLASQRSAGKTIKFNSEDIKIQLADHSNFKNLDFVLGAVENDMAKEFAPSIVKSGAIFIDNSSAFRQDPACPLVIPEINAEDAKNNKGIISNPNCSTIITLMAVAALNKISPIINMVACTYQAVSGAGQAGLDELQNQLKSIYEGKCVERNVFPHQIAMNVIPFIGSLCDNDYTTEEMKIQNEGRKILHLPSLNVSCTCVRVPVLRSHSISVAVRTKEYISVEKASEAISKFPGCKLASNIDGRDYPTPLDTSNQDAVWVGRIRRDLTADNALNLWCCGDQIRKGAAANAVQILKSLII